MSEIAEKAKEFLAEFSKEFLKSVTAVVLEQTTSQQEGGPPPLQLKYRNVKKPAAPSPLFQGACQMKGGEGPGSFKKWLPVYIKETPEHNLEVYADEQSAKSDGKKKPKVVILCAGYQIVTNVHQHYTHELKDLAPALGFSEEQLNEITQYSKHAWAFYHLWRPNYIFQLHQSVEAKGCLCIGGGQVAPEEDGIGATESQKRPDFLKAMESCIKKSSPRDATSTMSQAFMRTVGKMSQSYPDLQGFQDDGTEAQILTDMLLQVFFPTVRAGLIEKLKGPPPMRVKVYYKGRGQAQTVLQKLSDPAWTQMKTKGDQVLAKMEAAIQKAAGKVMEVKNKLMDKVKENGMDKLQAVADQHLKPHISKVIDALTRPWLLALEKNKEVIQKELPKITELPDDESKRNQQLDEISQSGKMKKEINDIVTDLVKPMEVLKEKMPEILATLDPGMQKEKAAQQLLKITDAVVYTLELRITAEGKKDELPDEVLTAYDSDAALMRREFLKSFIHDSLIDGFKKAIAAISGEILPTLEGLVPEDLQDIIDVAAMFDAIVETIVGEPIDMALDAVLG